LADRPSFVRTPGDTPRNGAPAWSTLMRHAAGNMQAIDNYIFIAVAHEMLTLPRKWLHFHQLPSQGIPS